jgi:hypothetical protein
MLSILTVMYLPDHLLEKYQISTSVPAFPDVLALIEAESTC